MVAWGFFDLHLNKVLYAGGAMEGVSAGLDSPLAMLHPLLKDQCGIQNAS